VRKTMFREIKVLQDYRNDNIVHLRSVFRENGKLYLIFDYIERTLLEELQAVQSQQNSDTEACGLPQK
jgi:cyclin-dependent kinase-like